MVLSYKKINKIMSTDIKHPFSKKVVNPTCDAARVMDPRNDSRMRGLAKSQFISLNDMKQSTTSISNGD